MFASSRSCSFHNASILLSHWSEVVQMPQFQERDKKWQLHIFCHPQEVGLATQLFFPCSPPLDDLVECPYDFKQMPSPSPGLQGYEI